MTTLTQKIHHPKADVERLYYERSQGGNGLVEIEETNESFRAYIKTDKGAGV